MFVKNELWKKYRLSIVNSVSDFDKAEKSHDLVSDYLERHPDMAKRYLAFNTCSKALYYFDVLSLAEKEKE